MMPTQYFGKRAIDLVGGLLLSVAALPVLLMCGLAVKVSSPGPVIFAQDRVGLFGRVFVIYKFRTMMPGTNPVIPEPAAITKVGKLLRRLSLDELPQLWNVLRGDMSLVGPRPTLMYQVERYTPRQLRRLSVRPGLTGLAQVMGRNTLAWSERIEYDLQYVDDQSLLLDLKVLLRTFAAVIEGSGVGKHAGDDPLSAVDQR